MTIGERIKLARKSKGLTQKKLGELSGTSEITVRQYELGKRQPRLEQLQRIASALGVSMLGLTGISEALESYMFEITEPDGGVSVETVQTLYEKLPDELKTEFWSRVYPTINSCPDKSRHDLAYSKLNEKGRCIAAERVEELAKIPDYQRKDTTPREDK